MRSGSVMMMDSDDVLARYLCGNDVNSSPESSFYLNESGQITSNSLPLNIFASDHSHQSSFCTKDNIENAVAFLSKELKLLGYPSLGQNGMKNINVVNMINATYELIQLHKANLKFQEELENRNSRTSSDLDYLHVTQIRLKNTLAQSEKNLAVLQERERQLTDQNKTLQQKLKSGKEEIKKLNGLQHQREVQYQHEIRKREKETIKLKERLNQLLADRSQSRCAGIEVLNNLPRKDGSRSKWKTNNLENKQEEEMYKSLIKDYEHRHCMVVEENTVLRHLLFQVNGELASVLQCAKPKNFKMSKIRSSSESSDGDTPEAKDPSLSDLEELTEGHFNMPIETLQDLMRNNLVKKFHYISNCLSSPNDEGNICDTTNPESNAKYIDIITKQNHLLEKAMKLLANDISSSDKKNFHNEHIAISKEWEQLKHVNDKKSKGSRTPQKKPRQPFDFESSTDIS